MKGLDTVPRTRISGIWYSSSEDKMTQHRRSEKDNTGEQPVATHSLHGMYTAYGLLNRIYLLPHIYHLPYPAGTAVLLRTSAMALSSYLDSDSDSDADS